MKIIALIPAKNEEKSLPLCIGSLKSWVDEIIVYDDHSTDNTRQVALNNGCVVITENFSNQSGWPEYEIRERLLAEARTRNATHLVGIDADEIFTPAFIKIAKIKLEEMEPGDSMSLRWITLWKENTTERIDGIFANLYKQFIFCDNHVSHHQYAFLGVGRIPHFSDGKVIKCDYNLGGVLHYQFATWEKTQIKQAWYRCSELIKGHRSAKRINATYFISLDGPHVITKTLPVEWVALNKIDGDELGKIWQFQEILKWFSEYGIEKFEPLQIWHIPELKEIFIERTGRIPKSEVFPDWLIYLNKHKNAIINYAREKLL